MSGVLRLLTDQNFNERIVEAVTRTTSEITADSVRAFGMERAVDIALLRLAEREGYVFVTHDANSVPHFVYEMIRAGEPVPRVVVVPERMAIGRAVDDLVLLLLAGTNLDWERNPFRLPL